MWGLQGLKAYSAIRGCFILEHNKLTGRHEIGFSCYPDCGLQVTAAPQKTVESKDVLFREGYISCRQRRFAEGNSSVIGHDMEPKNRTAAFSNTTEPAFTNQSSRKW